MNLETPISFGLLIVLAPALLGIAGIFFKVRAIHSELKNFWTIPHQRIWAEQFKSQNPHLHVPDVDATIKLLRRKHAD